MKKSFIELGLSKDSLEAIKKKGFEEPTDIQIKTIPLLLKGENDIIAQAQTGTGKTAAFALPLLELLNSKNKYPVAIVLTPTRELAIQVSEEMSSLMGRRKFNILPVYGGQSIERQIMKLRKGVDIVVGTPGRIIDHINRKTLKLHNIQYFILDEADEMLNMGFIEDIETILEKTDDDKRVLLFSATMPERIRNLAKKYLNNPKTILVKQNRLTTDLTEQIYFEISENNKFEALCRIIDNEEDFYGLVFCRTKVDADKVGNRLIDRGYDAEILHGDISQYQRERILNKFRKKKVNILVATDVAARGIDIVELTHVINYSIPQDPESYVHRIGRTGRAGKEGVAITFITPFEYKKLTYIKKIAKTDIKKGKLPGVEDIINIKKNRIKNEIKSIIDKKEYEKYTDIANELLNQTGDPKEIIGALLHYFVKDELSKENYTEINNNYSNSKYDQGKTRLFIALGKNNKMTKRELISFISDKVKIDKKLITDIKIFDKFSFITVPFKEAELIIRAFKKKNKRSIIEKANKKKSRK